MKSRVHGNEQQEPVGIVISRGTREDVAPLFRAYFWGPAPEPSTERAAPKAAA